MADETPDQEMPYLPLDVVSVTYDRDTDEVSVIYDGLNYLEAMSLLEIARNQIMDSPLEGEEDEVFDEDE